MRSRSGLVDMCPPSLCFASTRVEGILIPPEEVIEFTEPFKVSFEAGAAVFTGKIRVNEDYFNSAKPKFEYWPDATRQPELKMVPVPGGANFAEVAD